MHDRRQTVSKWPMGTGEMHARVRAYDWSATPLGPIDNWPQSLRFAVTSTLAAGFPTMLLWGKDLIQCCNDAYLRLMDWPEIPLGTSFQAIWPEYYAQGKADFEAVWRGETIATGRSHFPQAQFEGGRSVWLTTSVSPVHDEAGGVAGISIVMIDSTEHVLAEAQLRENAAQLTHLLDLLPVGVALFDTDWNAIVRNPEMQKLLRLPPYGPPGAPIRVFDGRGVAVDRDELPASRALRGEIVREDLSLEIAGERRWLKVGAVPFLRDGKIAGCITVGHDITEARNNAELLKVLVAELQHRTRNVIAVVRALARKTLEPSPSLAKFGERLEALARVQGLLSHLSEGDRVMFDQLLRTELAAHAALEDGRITLEGPAGVRLASATVQMLALGLHELATNAAKYGALTQPEGHLAVGWRLEPSSEDGGPQLFVDWRESGVVMPEADAGSRPGYGRELIERALPYQLGVKTTFELGADGVHCTLRLRVTEDAAA